MFIPKILKVPADLPFELKQLQLQMKVNLVMIASQDCWTLLHVPTTMVSFMLIVLGLDPQTAFSYFHPIEVALSI